MSSPYAPMPRQAAARPTRLSRLALISVGLGVLSIFPCALFAGIPAIICGALARSQINRDPAQGGGGAAIAGMVLGVVGVVVSPFILLWGSASLIIWLQTLGRPVVVVRAQAMHVVGPAAARASLAYAKAHDGRGPLTEEELEKFGFHRTSGTQEGLALQLFAYTADSEPSTVIIRVRDGVDNTRCLSVTKSGETIESKELQAALAEEERIRNAKPPKPAVERSK